MKLLAMCWRFCRVRSITGPTVTKMKLNVSLEARKFSFHHMFNALEWNKVSNQYCGLGRTYATRLGRCCCRHVKIVKNWLNAALRRLWILREIRRCSKITLACLARFALWKKVMNSNEVRIKTSLWSVWFSSMFTFFAPKFWTRELKFNPLWR